MPDEYKSKPSMISKYETASLRGIWKRKLMHKEVNDGVIWKSFELIREYNLLSIDGIHAATAFIAGAETIFSEDPDFDVIKGLKRKWIK